MAGRGTGVPYEFRCPVQRRKQYVDTDRIGPRGGVRDAYRFPDGHDKIVRTGRTRTARNHGKLTSRTLRVAHEFVCECGHRGWSYHAGVLDHPLDAAAYAQST